MRGAGDRHRAFKRFNHPRVPDYPPALTHIDRVIHGLILA
jgi:hypothetical protein